MDPCDTLAVFCRSGCNLVHVECANEDESFVCYWCVPLASPVLPMLGNRDPKGRHALRLGLRVVPAVPPALAEPVAHISAAFSSQYGCTTNREVIIRSPLSLGSLAEGLEYSSFGLLSSFVIRHSSFVIHTRGSKCRRPLSILPNHRIHAQNHTSHGCPGGKFTHV